jgi:hypothetical protein
MSKEEVMAVLDGYRAGEIDAEQEHIINQAIGEMVLEDGLDVFDMLESMGQ